MKIAHLADIHFSNKTELLKEAITVTDFAASEIEKQKPDIVLITGDLFDERVMLDSAAALAGISFVRRVAKVSPVTAIKGTDLHDFDSLNALQGLPNVTVVDKVSERAYKRGAGFSLPANEKPDAVVFCLPSLSKSFLVGLGSGSEVAEEQITALLGDVIRMWAGEIKKLKEEGIVTIVGGHGTIAGAVTSTGQVMLGHDLTYGTADLALLDADYVGFGHIHKSQKVGPAYYCGSLGRIDAGEKEDKGFYIVDIVPGKKPKMKFILTPARKFLIGELGVDPSSEDWRAQVLAMKAQIDAEPDPGKLVPKIKVVLSETNSGNITRKEVEELLGRSVIFDKDIIPVQRARAEGISKEITARGKYLKWAECADQRKDEEILKMVDMLSMPKEELLEAVKRQCEGEPETGAALEAPQRAELPAPGDAKQEEFALT